MTKNNDDDLAVMIIRLKKKRVPVHRSSGGREGIKTRTQGWWGSVWLCLNEVQAQDRLILNSSQPSKEQPCASELAWLVFLKRKEKR